MKTAFARKGFTLIEILVVISIIGILVAILYPSFNEARDDARNKALQTELKETKLAFELYKAQNGRYPTTVNALVPNYIADLPVESDSGNENCSISYQTDASGTWYKYTAARCHAGADTAAEGIKAGDEFARCLTTCLAASGCTADYRTTPAFYQSYAVYSAGGECKL
ncbi:MAG: type pilin [Candidatus Parcubacteria bacterium]|jgi:type II secretion system protein G